MNLLEIATIISVIATIPIYKSWAVKIWVLNKRRKVKSLESQLEFIAKLKNDKHFLILYCGQAIITVIGLLAASFMFEVMAILPTENIFQNGANLSHLFISIMAIASYITAVYKVGILHKVKEYERTCSDIETAIKKHKV